MSAGATLMARRGAVRPVAALFACLLLFLSGAAGAQSLEVQLPATVGDPRTPAVMRDLAERIIPTYQNPDRRQYLSHLSTLQEAAGSWAAAYAAQLSLAELDHRGPADVARTPAGVYELHTRAQALAAQERIPYKDALDRSFQALAAPLDDLSAYHLGRWLSGSPQPQEAALQRAFDVHRGQERISLEDALDLIQAYTSFDAQRRIAPLAPSLLAADEQRRYIIDDHLKVSTSARFLVEGVLVRPRTATRPLPAVLILTLDPERHTQATEAAAHGYVGVVMSARPLPSAPAGKGAPKALPPYEHEGEDARAVIRWITAQGFSNGQVAMMGQGYSGYVAWAAARGAPRGLAAIVAAGATAPGIDAPMEGNIFRNNAYRWALYFAGTTHDDGEAPHGRELDARWFESGRPYRDLDRVAGEPSAVFQRWLRHPTFDSYWQERLPSMHDLASLAIPVLTLTGYYDVGEAGALYYFTEQRRARPDADHILLAGPYDEEALRGAAPESLGGYRLDAAARVDLAELRYQWLDHVLRRAVRPGLLAAPINYEVMGANAWRHVAQLPTGVSLRLYLDQAPGGAALVRHKPAEKVSAGLTVDFRERKPPSLELDPPLLSRSLLWRDALRFVSDPLPDSVELTGHLVLNLLQSVNQRDVDLTVSLYEQLPGGEHLLLYAPPYEQRASFAQDRRNRSLLTPGRVQKLVLTSSRLLARRTEPGSRIELLLGVKRRADEQLNYGTGGDVSRESRADAHRPLTIRWYGGSYLEIPVGP